MFPKEIYRLILLQCDSETLLTCCNIRQLQDICDDHFWLSKFEHDNIPLICDGLMPHTLPTWVRQYKQLVEINMYVQWIMNMDNWYIKIYYSNRFTDLVNRLFKVLPLKPVFIAGGLEIKIHIKSFSYNLVNVTKVYKIKSEFIYFLHQLMYYVPEVIPITNTFDDYVLSIII